MDELDAPYIQAPRGLIKHQQLEIARELAPHDQLLLISARQGRGLNRGRGGADVVVGDHLLGVTAYLAVVTHQSPRIGRSVVVGQHQVVGQREGEDQPVALPVGRDESHAQVVEAAWAGPADGPTRELHRPARRPAQPNQRLDQLVLAVPRHPGDAEHLAGAHLETDAVHDLVASVVLHLDG